jgi:hypothetical protein
MCCSRRLHLSRHPQNVCWKLLNSCILLLNFAQTEFFAKFGSVNNSWYFKASLPSDPCILSEPALEEPKLASPISIVNLISIDASVTLFDKCSINARFSSYLQGIVSETSSTPQPRRQNRIQWNSILHDGSTKDRLFVFSANTHGALANQFYSHTVINCTLFIALVKRLKGPSVQLSELTIRQLSVPDHRSPSEPPSYSHILCNLICVAGVGECYSEIFLTSLLIIRCLTVSVTSI